MSPDTNAATGTGRQRTAAHGRTFRHDPRAGVALVLLALLALGAVAGPLLRPVDPDALDLANAGAAISATHPLGTDESGRDVLSRLLVGARVSLAIGVAAMIVAVLLGTAIGGIAGSGARWRDSLLMRFTDAVLSLPAILVVITVLTFLGPSVPALVAVIGGTSWMGLARLVRGQLLSLREQPYVEAARALGERPLPIFLQHHLPHLMPGILVSATLGVGTAILTESALSFLGLGVQPPSASWGNMLSGAQGSFYSYPWLAAWPGLMILLTVVCINLLGEALRDAAEPANRMSTDLQ